MNKFKRIFYYWLPVCLWALLKFTFSAHPTGQASNIDWQDFIVKKTAHVVFYAILTTLTFRALREYQVSLKSALIYSIFISTLYGASDEFHQSFIPGRDASVLDIGLDLLGALLAKSLRDNRG